MFMSLYLWIQAGQQVLFIPCYCPIELFLNCLCCWPVWEGSEHQRCGGQINAACSFDFKLHFNWLISRVVGFLRLWKLYLVVFDRKTSVTLHCCGNLVVTYCVSHKMQMEKAKNIIILFAQSISLIIYKSQISLTVTMSLLQTKCFGFLLLGLFLTILDKDFCKFKGKSLFVFFSITVGH